MSNPGDVTFSNVNGQRQGASNSTLDGIDVNDAVVPRLGLAMTANNMDSVGEVHIVTSGAKAEYGRNAGGQVELVTRSGTNRYHGNLFDYLRNTDLNANSFFNNASAFRCEVHPESLRRLSGRPGEKEQDLFLLQLPGKPHRAGRDTQPNRAHHRC
ncbi:MAG: hypothetical protein WDO73_28130 [Ignavibacteriota bacterium]